MKVFQRTVKHVEDLRRGTRSDLCALMPWSVSTCAACCYARSLLNVSKKLPYLIKVGT